MDPQALKREMGHKNISLTMDLYAQTDDKYNTQIELKPSTPVSTDATVDPITETVNRLIAAGRAADVAAYLAAVTRK